MSANNEIESEMTGSNWF